jgi:hypothetical protein
MLGTDAFGVVSGVAGLVAVAISLCHWMSPWRRLGALDTTIDQALRMLTVMEEEHVVLDCTIVLCAHEQLFRCVEFPCHATGGCVETECPSARQRPRASDFGYSTSVRSRALRSQHSRHCRWRSPGCADRSRRYSINCRQVRLESTRTFRSDIVPTPQLKHEQYDLHRSSAIQRFRSYSSGGTRRLGL